MDYAVALHSGPLVGARPPARESRYSFFLAALPALSAHLGGRRKRGGRGQRFRHLHGPLLRTDLQEMSLTCDAGIQQNLA